MAGIILIKLVYGLRLRLKDYNPSFKTSTILVT